MTFGKKLKKRRLEMGMTQEKFAFEFNKIYNFSFNKSTISNYENDFRNPEVNVLTKLAEFMNLSIDYLLKNEIPLPNAKIEEIQEKRLIVLDKKMQEVNLDPKEKEEMISIFEKIAESYFKSKK